MSNENLIMILTFINTIISPIVIYFFRSINNKMTELDLKIEKLDDKINEFGNRVTKIETTCSIKHK